MNNIELIENFDPFNDQEDADRNFILECLKNENDVYLRKNKKVHMTVSAWVINQNATKVLMVYHNIYKSWSWLGGHCDGDTDLMRVAEREVKEESGIENLKAITNDIYSIEVLPVSGHMKHGNYVSSHIHLNTTFLLMADDSEKLQIKPDENSGVKWVNIEDSVSISNEPWIRENVYRKLNDKLSYVLKGKKYE